jgi:DNA-binding response OmpR family regulator
VVVALSGEVALERLEMVLVVAVLLDAVMPGLSGFETCKRIKANPAFSHVPVIFMTGLSETDALVSGFDSGGVDYVVKPVKAEEVLARLQVHIRNARVARLAREAVDVAGFGVVLIDSGGRIAWHSPRARLWLKEDLSTLDLSALLQTGSERLTFAGYPELSVRNLGKVGLGETMLLLAQATITGGDSARLQQAALTQRESEVLSWLAKGKTNRDIAEIRLARLAENTVRMARDYISGITYDGIFVWVNGDIVSGNIHDELTATNELNSMPSVLDLYGVLVGVIEKMAATPPAVIRRYVDIVRQGGE